MHTIGVHDCIQYSTVTAVQVLQFILFESLFIVYNKMNVRSHKKFLIYRYYDCSQNIIYQVSKKNSVRI